MLIQHSTLKSANKLVSSVDTTGITGTVEEVRDDGFGEDQVVSRAYFKMREAAERWPGLLHPAAIQPKSTRSDVGDICGSKVRGGRSSPFGGDGEVKIGNNCFFSVLDLGAAPGGWSQWLVCRGGANLCVAVDPCRLHRDVLALGTPDHVICGRDGDTKTTAKGGSKGGRIGEAEGTKKGRVVHVATTVERAVKEGLFAQYAPTTLSHGIGGGSTDIAGISVKTSTFLKMASQAKPLCS